MLPFEMLCCCVHVCCVPHGSPTAADVQSSCSLQGAQLNVLAYPHDLRVFGVADCIALDMGQPTAAELLAHGAAQVKLNVA